MKPSDEQFDELAARVVDKISASPNDGVNWALVCAHQHGVLIDAARPFCEQAYADADSPPRDDEIVENAALLTMLWWVNDHR